MSVDLKDTKIPVGASASDMSKIINDALEFAISGSKLKQTKANELKTKLELIENIERKRIEKNRGMRDDMTFQIRQSQGTGTLYTLEVYRNKRYVSCITYMTNFEVGVAAYEVLMNNAQLIFRFQLEDAENVLVRIRQEDTMFSEHISEIAVKSMFSAVNDSDNDDDSDDDNADDGGGISEPYGFDDSNSDYDDGNGFKLDQRQRQRPHKTKTCRHFLVGTCNKGSACVYKHYAPLCRNWKAGSCDYGRRCRFFHPNHQSVNYKADKADKAAQANKNDD